MSPTEAADQLSNQATPEPQELPDNIYMHSLSDVISKQ